MTQIVDSPALVDERLQHLGLRADWLLGSVLEGDAGASSATALHPPGDAGFRRWADTVAALRTRLLPQGWDMSNTANYCTVFNRTTRTAVVVMAGDLFTGTRLGTPKSRYPKGAATQARILVNVGQASLFPSLKSPDEIVEEDCVTFALVQFPTEAGIQAELSRPSSMSASGYVNAWRERILLPTVHPGGHHPEKNVDDTPDAPDIDFAVTPR